MNGIIALSDLLPQSVKKCTIQETKNFVKFVTFTLILKGVDKIFK
jgi:hypothetical protein